MGGALAWQHDVEHHAGRIQDIAGMNLAAVIGSNQAHDLQALAQMTFLWPFAQGHERIEDLAGQVFGQGRAGVVDLESPVDALILKPHLDRLTLRCKVPGVIDELIQQLDDQLRRPRHHASGAGTDVVDLVLRIEALIGGRSLTGNICQIEDFWLHLIETLLQPRRFAHTLQDLAQAIRRLECAGDVGRFRHVGRIVLEIFQGRAHDGDRRLQFVGQAAGETLQVVGIALQVVHQMTELAREFPQFVLGRASRHALHQPTIAVEAGGHISL